MNRAILEILHILCKHIKLLVASFLVVFIPVAIATYTQPPIFQASGRLLLSEQLPYLQLLPGGARPRQLEDVDINNEIQSIMSPPFIAKVVNVLPPELAGHGGSALPKASHFCSHLSVARVPFSSLVEIAYTDKNPALAAAVVNTILDTYPSYQATLYQDPASLRFYKNQMEDLEKQLASMDQQLEKFEADGDLVSLQQERDQALDRIDYCRSRMIATQTDLDQGKGKIAQIEKLILREPKHMVIAQDRNDPVAEMLYKRLVSLKVEEKALLEKYTKHHPEVVKTTNEIKAIQTQLESGNMKEYSVSLKHRIGPNIVYKDLVRELSEQKVKRGQQLAKIESLKKQLKSYRSEARGLNMKGYELKRMQEAREQKKERYYVYMKKAEESRIAAEMEREGVGNVRVVDTAHVPTSPMKSGASMALVLAAVVGAGTGVGGALTVEYIRPTFHFSVDVERHLGLPVLAVIPEVKDQA